jgi:hypothetical protein
LDDDDFDDVVVVVLNSPAVQAQSAVSVRSICMPVPRIELLKFDAIPAPAHAEAYPRAPLVVFAPAS